MRCRWRQSVADVGVIRQAAAAHHYLSVFDGHTECPLYLGRSRRLASAAQRIVLYAKDRG